MKVQAEERSEWSRWLYPIFSGLSFGAIPLYPAITGSITAAYVGFALTITINAIIAWPLNFQGRTAWWASHWAKDQPRWTLFSYSLNVLILIVAVLAAFRLILLLLGR
jgi:hypothetical protein